VTFRIRWRPLGLTVAAVLVVGGALQLARGMWQGSVNRLQIDLRQPDLLIRSARLSRLPQALAEAPLLRGVLSEDVVHYYEDHPAGLSLAGTLKRLAYDHHLTLADHLLATVLDAPGELALWRDGHGMPSHFVLMLEHNLAAEAALALAKVSLPDKQLSVAGEVGGIGRKTTVYALQVDNRNTWLLASRGGRTVLLSHPGLLLDAPGALSKDAADVVAQALATKAGGVSPFADAFALPAREPAVSQQLVARVDYLGMGYQHFFPGLAALRAELREPAGWQAAVRADGATASAWLSGASRLWPSLPRSSALCAALPLNLAGSSAVLEQAGVADPAAFLKDLAPTGAVCWGAGGLFSPMLALQWQAGTGARHDEALATVMTQALRSPPTQPNDGEAADGDEATPATAKPRAELDTAVQRKALAQPAGGLLWTRAVPHEHGNTRLAGQPVNVVAMARLGDTWLASTDLRTVQQAIDVAAKTQPALSDRPMTGATAVLAIDGGHLAALLDAETWRTLRPQTAPTFHRVARELLPPRLAALRQLGPVQIGLAPLPAPPGSGLQWLPLQVQHQAALAKPAAAPASGAGR